MALALTKALTSAFSATSVLARAGSSAILSRRVTASSVPVSVAMTTSEKLLGLGGGEDLGDLVLLRLRQAALHQLLADAGHALEVLHRVERVERQVHREDRVGVVGELHGEGGEEVAGLLEHAVVIEAARHVELHLGGVLVLGKALDVEGAQLADAAAAVDALEVAELLGRAQRELEGDQGRVERLLAGLAVDLLGHLLVLPAGLGEARGVEERVGAVPHHVQAVLLVAEQVEVALVAVGGLGVHALDLPLLLGLLLLLLVVAVLVLVALLGSGGGAGLALVLLGVLGGVLLLRVGLGLLAVLGVLLGLGVDLVLGLLGLHLERGRQVARVDLEVLEQLAALLLRHALVDAGAGGDADDGLDVLGAGDDLALAGLDGLVEAAGALGVALEVAAHHQQAPVGGRGVLELLLDEVAVAQLLEDVLEGVGVVAERLEELDGALGGLGLGVAVDEVGERQALDLQRLGAGALEHRRAGGGLEVLDGLGVLAAVDPHPAHLVAGQVVGGRGGRVEDLEVVGLGVVELALVEVVVGDDEQRLGHQRAARVLVDDLLVGGDGLVELAQLPVLVRLEEAHLVVLLVVGELVEDALVEADGLLLEQRDVGDDQRAALALLDVELGLQVEAVAALLDVELGLAEDQVGQIGRGARRGDQLLGDVDRPVDLDEVAAQLGDELGALVGLAGEVVLLHRRPGGGAGRGGERRQGGEEEPSCPELVEGIHLSASTAAQRLGRKRR
ncbi:MAG: hypothetical protein QM765_42890 [Myxococcales bacterium]